MNTGPGRWGVRGDIQGMSTGPGCRGPAGMVVARTPARAVPLAKGVFFGRVPRAMQPERKLRYGFMGMSASVGSLGAFRFCKRKSKLAG